MNSSTATSPRNDVQTISSAIPSSSKTKQSQMSQQTKSPGNNQTSGVTLASFCGTAPTNLSFSAGGQPIEFHKTRIIN